MYLEQRDSWVWHHNYCLSVQWGETCIKCTRTTSQCPLPSLRWYSSRTPSSINHIWTFKDQIVHPPTVKLEGCKKRRLAGWCCPKCPPLHHAGGLIFLSIAVAVCENTVLLWLRNWANCSEYQWLIEWDGALWHTPVQTNGIVILLSSAISTFTSHLLALISNLKTFFSIEMIYWRLANESTETVTSFFFFTPAAPEFYLVTHIFVALLFMFII